MKTVRWKKVESLAQAVLEECGVSEGPVPIEALVLHYKIQIRLEPLESNLSGFLFRSKGSAVIGVNSMQAKVRQRFTLAHELAHFLLHQEETLKVDRTVFTKLRSNLSGQGSDPEEIEANQFAAAILMPSMLLERDMMTAEHVDVADDSFISALASKYSVSNQAMLLRLVKLGYVEEQTQAI